MSYSVSKATRRALAMVSFLYVSGGLVLADAAAGTDTADAAASPGGSPNSPGSLDEVVVIAQRLNEARNGIQTQTGASIYTINEAAIGAEPGGDNQLLNQVIMQAPEV